MPSAVSNGLPKSDESTTIQNDEVDFIPTHPLGVKPLGNQYLAKGPNARRSIGTWDKLPDEVLMLILEYFDKSQLRQLSHTCKLFYAFCHSEELWKAIFLR